MAIPTLNLGNTPTNPGWRYAAAIALLTPFVLGFNAFRAFRMGDRRYFFERLGHGGIPNCDAPLWIHAASVGEVHATRPLVSGIRHARAELPILVTTVTPTGAAAVARLGKGVHH